MSEVPKFLTHAELSDWSCVKEHMDDSIQDSAGISPARTAANLKIISVLRARWKHLLKTLCGCGCTHCMEIHAFLKDNFQEEPCPMCGGEGTVGDEGFDSRAIDCTHCDGTGKVVV